jgi:plastocyanin
VTRTPIRSVIVVLMALIGVAALGGCSNSEGAANRQPHTGATTAVAVNGIEDVRLTVDAGFRFTPSTITVHPGKVRITLEHIATGAPHDWQLTGIPGDYVAPVSPGESGSVTFIAPSPGTYSFVCTIHERQGQTGTMIVLGS